MTPKEKAKELVEWCSDKETASRQCLDEAYNADSIEEIEYWHKVKEEIDKH